MKGRTFWEIGGFRRRRRADSLRHRRDLHGRQRVQHDPRRDQGRGHHVRLGRRSRCREVRGAVGRRAGHDRRPGSGVREGHARAHAREHRRPDVRARWAASSRRRSRTIRQARATRQQPRRTTNGQPVSNGARNIWVTETALTTALNMSYMAERLSVFGLVVGIALLLTGIGLVILAFAVFGREREPETQAAAASARPVDELIRDRREAPGSNSGSASRSTERAAPAALSVSKPSRDRRRRKMKVQEIMTRDVVTVGPEADLRDVARSSSTTASPVCPSAECSVSSSASSPRATSS